MSDSEYEYSEDESESESESESEYEYSDDEPSSSEPVDHAPAADHVPADYDGRTLASADPYAELLAEAQELVIGSKLDDQYASSSDQLCACIVSQVGERNIYCSKKAVEIKNDFPVCKDHLECRNYPDKEEHDQIVVAKRDFESKTREPTKLEFAQIRAGEEACVVCKMELTEEDELSDALLNVRDGLKFYHPKCYKYEHDNATGKTDKSLVKGTMTVRILTTPMIISTTGTSVDSVIQMNSEYEGGRTSDGVYSGRRETAYLPNNEAGQMTLGLIIHAFKQGILYVPGELSTGEYGLVRNIHQKTAMTGGTSSYGWPDDTYFERVMGELIDSGIKGKYAGDEALNEGLRRVFLLVDGTTTSKERQQSYYYSLKTPFSDVIPHVVASGASATELEVEHSESRKPVSFIFSGMDGTDLEVGRTSLWELRHTSGLGDINIISVTVNLADFPDTVKDLFMEQSGYDYIKYNVYFTGIKPTAVVFYDGSNNETQFIRMLSKIVIQTSRLILSPFVSSNSSKENLRELWKDNLSGRSVYKMICGEPMEGDHKLGIIRPNRDFDDIIELVDYVYDDIYVNFVTTEGVHKTADFDDEYCDSDSFDVQFTVALQYLRAIDFMIRNIRTLCTQCGISLGVSLPYFAHCGDALCKYQFSSIPVSTNLLDIMRANPEITDMQINIFFNFLRGSRVELALPGHLNDPTLTTDREKAGKFISLINSLPSVRDMLKVETDDDLRGLIGNDAHMLILWIVTSLNIKPNSKKRTIPDKLISNIAADITLYDINQTDAPIMKKFLKSSEECVDGTGAAGAGGAGGAGGASRTKLLIHGSRPESWFGIIKNGLKTMSGTKYQSFGAAYGPGVYLGSNMAVANYYTLPFKESWDKSSKTMNGKRVMLLCAVTCAESYLQNPGIYVVPSGKEYHITPLQMIVFSK